VRHYCSIGSKHARSERSENRKGAFAETINACPRTTRFQADRDTLGATEREGCASFIGRSRRWRSTAISVHLLSDHAICPGDVMPSSISGQTFPKSSA